MVDPALVASILQLDINAIALDGGLLGKILDTFAAAQLRVEAAVSTKQIRLFHLRSKGGDQEIDLVAEIGGTKLIGIEIEAASGPSTTSQVALLPASVAYGAQLGLRRPRRHLFVESII